ncbi:hypothetical protein H7F33_11035 [Pedobacter sp. PAMC26386]|nr:hypothetical protein H7F33_11035 [Pedobacter sp. PAMC26386]
MKYKLNNTNDIERNLWYQKLVVATNSAEGFIDRSELSPVDGEEFHTVVLRFNTSYNAKGWINSDKRRQILSEASIEHISGREEMLHINNQFWFQATDNKKMIPGWKQVIASFLAVYPLTIFVPKIVAVLFANIHLLSILLSGITVSVIISTLMVYIAIPAILWLLKKWIYNMPDKDGI